MSTETIGIAEAEADRVGPGRIRRGEVADARPRGRRRAGSSPPRRATSAGSGAGRERVALDEVPVGRERQEGQDVHRHAAAQLPRQRHGRPGCPATSATVNSGWLSAVPTTPSFTMPKFSRAPTSKVNLSVVRAFCSKASWMSSREVLSLAVCRRRPRSGRNRSRPRRSGPRRRPRAAPPKKAVAVRQPRLARRQARRGRGRSWLYCEAVVRPAAGNDVLEVDDRIDPGVGNVRRSRARSPLGGHEADRRPETMTAVPGPGEVGDPGDDHRDELRAAAVHDVVPGQARRG